MDSKSAGILGGCLVIAALVITLVPGPTDPQLGRFQIRGISNHMYVIDTATGQVWDTFVQSNSGGTGPSWANPKVE
jgi:hypothetical protein